MRTADTASSLAVIYLAHVPACAGSSDTDTFGEVKARSIIRSWVLQQVLGLHASAGKPGHGESFLHQRCGSAQSPGWLVRCQHAHRAER